LTHRSRRIKAKQEEVVPTQHPHPLGLVNTLQESSDNVFARTFSTTLCANGVDLSSLVPGIGKGRRIEKGDVEAYLTHGHANTNSVAKTDQLEDFVVSEERAMECGKLWSRYDVLPFDIIITYKFLFNIQSLEIPHFRYFLSPGTV
jgi:pyruvate/2-oxoglutarate dehydrogenase complex dihydrolipoamide acyltransferase (E2) component